MTNYNQSVAIWGTYPHGYNGVSDATFLQQVQQEIIKAQAGKQIATVPLKKDVGVFYMRPGSVAGACLISAFWLAKAAQRANYMGNAAVAQEAIIFANKCISDFRKPGYKADKTPARITAVLNRTEGWLRANGMPGLAAAVAGMTPPKGLPSVIIKKPRRLTVAEKKLAQKRKILGFGFHHEMGALGFHHEMGSYGLVQPAGINTPMFQSSIDTGAQLPGIGGFGATERGLTRAKQKAAKLKREIAELKEKKESARTRARKRIIQARIQRKQRQAKRLLARLKRVESRLKKKIARRDAKGKSTARARRLLAAAKAKKIKKAKKAKKAKAKRAALRKRQAKKMQRTGMFQPGMEEDELLMAEETFDTSIPEEASVSMEELDEDVDLDVALDPALPMEAAFTPVQEEPFYKNPLVLGGGVALLAGIGLYVAKQRQEAQA